MTVTILSLVCIVLAALCLWVYACSANEDLIEAQWEADYNYSLYETAARQLKEKSSVT